MTAAVKAAPTPWYVEVLLALGGWISGLLAAIAIFAMGAAVVAGSDSDGDITIAFIAVLAGAGFVGLGARIGKKRSNEFARHFAIAAIAAGLTAATAGFWYLSFKLFDGAWPGAERFSGGASGLFAAAALAVTGFYVSRAVKDGILTFLTTLAVYGVSLTALTLLLDGNGRMIYWLAALSVLAGNIWFSRLKRPNPALAASAALMIGPMLQFTAFTAMRGFTSNPSFEGASTITSAILVAAVLYNLVVLMKRYSLPSILAACAILTAGVWLLPLAGGVAIVILCTAIAANHRGLAIVGVIALTWFISRYYYDLSATLLEKSIILSAMGAATLLGAMALRRLSSARDQHAGREAPASDRRRSLLATIAFAGVLAAAYGLINQSVYRLETAFRDARTIYLPLGPRDPRSIIQGDYMVLNFRQAIYPPQEEIDALPETGQVILSLDENNVASFSRLASPGDAPATDEIRVNYVKDGRSRMRYCPTSFFFQEGDAPTYQSARFAVLKVAEDGGALLVDLADEYRNIIKPED